MDNHITIVTCYKAGTSSMLEACLASIERHTDDVKHTVVVQTKMGEADVNDGIWELQNRYSFFLREIVVPPSNASKAHGFMLDSFIPECVAAEYVLTLDSDCFPVADGWLSSLIDLLKEGVAIAGILHPWAPPPADMKKTKIEWRVRSQHCWQNTHVACQLIRTEDVEKLGKKYNEGDDTGLAIVTEAKKRGWTVDGFMPTRCAKPIIGKIDPEFNRYVCMIYGDAVYHHGGFSRVTGGDEPVFKDDFGWVTERVIKERGAEFLLDDVNCYRFKFDKEEEVAAEKMQRLFGLKSQRMA